MFMENKSVENKNYEIEEMWLKICNHLKIIEERNEEGILIGDLNKLVGNGPLGVKDNNPKVTFGGKLVHKLLETGKYLLLNNSSKCKGGPFTRVDPSNINIKSCLSLVIISVGLEEYVHELLIDKERQFTPHRAVQKNRIPVFTDHFSLLITFKNIPQKMKSLNKARSSVMWNTRKEDGWKKYHELTSNDVKLKKIAESSNELSSDEIMGKLSRRMDKIKFQAFGKVKIKSRTVTNDRELAKLYDEKAKENCDPKEAL